MTGIVNSTGAKSGVIGTTVGTVTLAKMAGGTDGNLITYDTSGDPAYVATGTSGHVLTSAGADAVPSFQAASGGASAGMISNVFKFKQTGADTETTNTVTKSISCPSMTLSGVVSGRHYIIHGAQYVSPQYTAGDATLPRYADYDLYIGTTSRSAGDTTSFGTQLTSLRLGRDLHETSTGGASSYHMFAYTAWYTAASTATHYIHTTHRAGDNNAARSFNGTGPHWTIVYEVMP